MWDFIIFDLRLYEVVRPGCTILKYKIRPVWRTISSPKISLPLVNFTTRGETFVQSASIKKISPRVINCIGRGFRSVADDVKSIPPLLARTIFSPHRRRIYLNKLSKIFIKFIKLGQTQTTSAPSGLNEGGKFSESTF